MTTATHSYESTASLTDLADRIRQAQRVTVMTHAKPDGDAMGSCLAMSRALASSGVHCGIWLIGPMDESLALLAGPTPFHVIDEKANETPTDDAEVIVVVDTGAWAQLEPLTDWLAENREKVIGIDHHPRGDGVAPARYIDSSAGSTTLILLELFDVMGIEITGGENGIAEALFLGLATDTGWFKYDNADNRVFAAAARLMAAGVDKSRLYQLTDESYEPRRLDLEARALASLEYLDGGRIALMRLTQQDFSETGGSVLDLTGMVNMPMSVTSVRASILMCETDDGRAKLSLRSKPSVRPGDVFINVNELAQRFGGGGHVHAAGARINGSLEEARQKLIDALAE